MRKAIIALALVAFLSATPGGAVAAGWTTGEELYAMWQELQATGAEPYRSGKLVGYVLGALRRQAPYSRRVRERLSSSDIDLDGFPRLVF